MFRLYCDGSCVPNPGDMTVSYALYYDNELLGSGYNLPAGRGTNNLAEYRALLLGLEIAKVWCPEAKDVVVFIDSELVYNQLKGRYRVKKAHLRKPYLHVKQILQETGWKLCQLPREELNTWLSPPEEKYEITGEYTVLSER